MGCGGVLAWTYDGGQWGWGAETAHGWARVIMLMPGQWGWHVKRDDHRICQPRKKVFGMADSLEAALSSAERALLGASPFA